MLLLDQHGRPIDTKALAAARRIAERAKRMDSLSASYDAAANTAETAKHWRYADNLSAAAANSVSVRKTLRERSRYECLENNSFAKGIVLTLSNDTISTGPSLQVQLEDSSASRMIEAKWRKWCKDVRLASKLRTARIAKVIDGETIILKGTNRRSKNAVKLDIRIIECDQLATPHYFDGQPNKVDGIEFDDFGNPIEYHILKGHPGDRWPMGSFDHDKVNPEDLIHLFRAERPGQMRGIPELTPALPLFAMLRRYTLAVITAAENAADFSAILKTQSNAFDSASDGIDDIDPFDFVQIDRGMMTSLPKGWEMVQFDPKQPTTTYREFRDAILGEIARSVHMPSNKALADSSKYNYSSGRLDHQTYYESIAIERSQWEVEALDRIFEWWLDEALMLDGYLPAIEAMEEVPKVWRWPPQRDVNPAEIADVNIELIRAGLKSRQMYLIEQNIDPEAHAKQLVEEGWRDPDATIVEPIETAPQTPVVDDVAKLALNGAQVASLVQIVNAVATGTMPKDTAKALVQSAFPSMDSATIDGIVNPIVPGSVSLDGSPQPVADPEESDGAEGTSDEPAPTGEFANMSRLQLNRNSRAIDDTLTKLDDGTWTIPRARVFLESLGLKSRTIDNLLAEYDEQPA